MSDYHRCTTINISLVGNEKTIFILKTLSYVIMVSKSDDRSRVGVSLNSLPLSLGRLPLHPCERNLSVSFTLHSRHPAASSFIFLLKYTHDLTDLRLTKLKSRGREASFDQIGTDSRSSEGSRLIQSFSTTNGHLRPSQPKSVQSATFDQEKADIKPNLSGPIWPNLEF